MIDLSVNVVASLVVLMEGCVMPALHSALLAIGRLVNEPPPVTVCSVQLLSLTCSVIALLLLHVLLCSIQMAAVYRSAHMLWTPSLSRGSVTRYCALSYG